ncbi:putative protein TPRXL [Ipomoea triloba]|uniref:putative protein TPRXL n=1 Tax=Ipomoea triloba TaxID=35885 RepID=UPI00125D05AB|nr:putative protein TPRXL [Ipomoea triloba]
MASRNPFSKKTYAQATGSKASSVADSDDRSEVQGPLTRSRARDLGVELDETQSIARNIVRRLGGGSTSSKKATYDRGSSSTTETVGSKSPTPSTKAVGSESPTLSNEATGTKSPSPILSKGSTSSGSSSSPSPMWKATSE